MKLPSSTSSSDGLSAAVRILAKLGVFAILALTLQWLFYQIFTPPETSLITGGQSRSFGTNPVESRSTELSLAGLQRMAARKPSLLFMGDSTTMSLEPRPGPTTPELLNAELPQCRLDYIIHPGFHLDTFVTLYRYEATLGDSIGLVVVPINVRAFGPLWQENREYRFEYLHNQVFLEESGLRFLERPIHVFGAFDSVQPRAKGLDEIKPRNLYQFELEPNNQALAWLVQLDTLAKAHGAELLVYLTPLNLRFARETMGEDTETLIGENVERLRQFCRSKGINVLDLTTTLPADDFLNLYGTLGHLNEAGRDSVAHALAEEIVRLRLVDCATPQVGAAEPARD